jgi:hypothetical protein
MYVYCTSLRYSNLTAGESLGTQITAAPLYNTVHIEDRATSAPPLPPPPAWTLSAIGKQGLGY